MNLNESQCCREFPEVGEETFATTTQWNRMCLGSSAVASKFNGGVGMGCIVGSFGPACEQCILPTGFGTSKLDA